MYEEMKQFAPILAALPDKSKESLALLAELAVIIQGGAGQGPEPEAEKAS